MPQPLRSMLHVIPVEVLNSQNGSQDQPDRSSALFGSANVGWVLNNVLRQGVAWRAMPLMRSVRGSVHVPC